MPVHSSYVPLCLVLSSNCIEAAFLPADILYFKNTSRWHYRLVIQMQSADTLQSAYTFFIVKLLSTSETIHTHLPSGIYFIREKESDVMQKLAIIE
jgi:hypothetical protein